MEFVLAMTMGFEELLRESEREGRLPEEVVRVVIGCEDDRLEEVVAGGNLGARVGFKELVNLARSFVDLLLLYHLKLYTINK